MWRPDGWKTIKENRWGDVGLSNGMFRDREIEFEAGADAMLKAIKGQPACPIIASEIKENVGIYYLIPDDEVEDD